MAKPKRKWPKIVAMVLAATVLTGALALALVDSFMPEQTLIPQSLVELPGRLVSSLLKPLQGAFAWATNGVSGYLADLKLQKTIEIEYNKLKAQNDELIYASLYSDELEQENERLKKLLGVYEEYRELNPIMASVTTKETSNWFQMFSIDKGSEHGIEANMAVINAQGLIGYVYKVQALSSEVISIIDSRAGVSGIIQSSRAQGVIRGTLGVDNEPTCRMYYLPVDHIARPGDIVVTSGIGMQFPKGLKIGEVRESTRYLDENKQYVVVEPYVDFENLEEVLVLVYVAPEEEMPDDSDGQVQYVAGQLDSPRPVPSLGAQINDPNLGAVTAPPRSTRIPGSVEDTGEAGDATPTDAPTLEPGATPSPTPTTNPELNELLRQELEAEESGDEEAVG